MKTHTRILLAAISTCLVWSVEGCATDAGQGTTTGTGGGTSHGGALGSGGGPERGASGGSSTGGNGSGGRGDTGGRASGGTGSTTSSATAGAGGSAGGQTSSGGTASGGRQATGGSASGGATSAGGAGGSAGRKGSGGSADSSVGGSMTGGAAAGSGYSGHEGFYKELFVDFGVGLDHLPGLPAADGLKWEWDLVATDDANVQHSWMWGNANDDNGALLYPDREPRFMLMYTGGGYGDHATAVGDTGIKNVRDFFYNGGSYVGSCNGNYMAWEWAYELWPGQIQLDSFEGRVAGIIPNDSPLLRYYDFGGDHLISAPDPGLFDGIGLMHYSGGFEIGTLPAGTEVLLVGKSHTTKIGGDGHPTGYAYKPKATSGRVCGMNDHPEYALQPGEVMNYLQASLLYARDGVAAPDVKAPLANGEERLMNKSSGDNDPAHAKIGDKQYHHFTVSLPDGAKEMTVTLVGDTGYDMNLYLAKGTFALASRASRSDTAEGSSKTLTVSSLEAGTWYVGVECATTVTATKTSTGTTYSGDLAVLNGVKYSIKASWTK